MPLEKDTEQTTEQAEAEVGDDEAEVTKQTAEKEAKAGKEETEHGCDGEDDGTEKLTVTIFRAMYAHSTRDKRTRLRLGER